MRWGRGFTQCYEWLTARTRLPHHSAAIHIEGRGYQLADGIYELIAVVCGSVAKALSAREAFLTSTIVDRLPVVRIDGVPLGKGQPGLLSRKLRKCYLAHAASMGSV